MQIKKGDNVLITVGKDKGKTGRVLRVIPRASRVLVEGFNTAKRRRRPRKEGEKGQTVIVPMPVHASNIMKVDSKGNRTVRAEGSRGKSRARRGQRSKEKLARTQ